MEDSYTEFNQLLVFSFFRFDFEPSKMLVWQAHKNSNEKTGINGFTQQHNNIH